MRHRKKKDDETKEKKTPGPPMRPKKAKERAARRIWLTVNTRGGGAWDTWVGEPGGIGLEVMVPWSDKPRKFAAGEMKGAYPIVFDEVHNCRRVTVYDGLPLAPTYIREGSWEEVADMAAEVKMFIENTSKEKIARLGAAMEPFPRWGIALIVMAAMTSAVAIVNAIMR